MSMSVCVLVASFGECIVELLSVRLFGFFGVGIEGVAWDERGGVGMNVRMRQSTAGPIRRLPLARCPRQLR